MPLMNTSLRITLLEKFTIKIKPQIFKKNVKLILIFELVLLTNIPEKAFEIPPSHRWTPLSILFVAKNRSIFVFEKYKSKSTLTENIYTIQ